MARSWGESAVSPALWRSAGLRRRVAVRTTSPIGGDTRAYADTASHRQAVRRSSGGSALNRRRAANSRAGRSARPQARGLPSTIAVTDRVGNVLAVFNMTGAPADHYAQPPANRRHRRARADTIGLQGANVPCHRGAIAKAITGAYLSSGGNAFSTRTASQIVQEHFPPAPTTVRARKRAAVRRAIQPVALFGPQSRVSHAAAAGRIYRPETITAGPGC